MKSDYAAKREELAKLQEELHTQNQERKQKLKEEEMELVAEEERLSQLRSASSREADQLLKKQKSELRDVIEKEKKTIASLKR